MKEKSLMERASLMRSGEQSCVATLEPYLARIAEREPTVSAWAWCNVERAEQQAASLDALPVSQRHGALFGVPIGVKDIFDTVDMPTEYGSPIYRDHQPRYDAACVAALKQAGAILLGKTVTTEFAALHPGRTINPHDPRRTPGGSSSGSAAAVADGMVSAALGSQTAGSVIRPAAFCGTVGFKPTFNTINRRGMSPLSEFTDTIGVLTRSVRDAVELVGVLARRDLNGTATGSAPRIAVCQTPEWPSAKPETRQTLDQCAKVLAAAGADVAVRSLPVICNDLFAVGQKILCAEASFAFAHEYNQHCEQLSDKLRGLIETGQAVDAESYERARKTAVEARHIVEDDVFGEVDAILTPSAAGAAPMGTDSTGSPAFNHIWTLLHLPCITLPVGRTAEGMPLGIQLVGARDEDRKLTAIAKWAEASLSAA